MTKFREPMHGERAREYLPESQFATVYRFDEAPAELRALSTNGGDEDWLVIVPASWSDEWLPWVDVMEAGGTPQKHVLPDGRIVFIGSHA